MTEIKQCPFCSGEASIYHGDSTDGYIKGTGYVEVFCGWCGARIREKKKDEVIKKWNTRPNPWHTGTPTEEGWYLLHTKETIPYRVAYMRDDRLSTSDSYIRTDIVIEWQKV